MDVDEVVSEASSEHVVMIRLVVDRSMSQHESVGIMMEKHLFERDFEIRITQCVQERINCRVQIAKPNNRCVQRRADALWRDGSRDEHHNVWQPTRHECTDDDACSNKKLSFNNV